MTTTPNVPETVQELLKRQEEKQVDFLQLALKSLLQCSAEENAKVAGVILETLRDWHLKQCEEADNPLPWVIDATRLDLALKSLNLVSWD